MQVASVKRQVRGALKLAIRSHEEKERFVFERSPERAKQVEGRSREATMGSRLVRQKIVGGLARTRIHRHPIARTLASALLAILLFCSSTLSVVDLNVSLKLAACSLPLSSVAWAEEQPAADESAQAEAAASSEKPIAVGPSSLTDRERALGERLAMISDVTSLFVDNEALQARMQALCDRIAPVTGRPQVSYKVTVVQSPAFNAWVVGDGRIYITSTLIEMLRSDEAIGAVLAHEIGHVVAEHPAELYTRILAMGAVAMALKIASAAGVATVPIGSAGDARVFLDLAGVAQDAMILMGLRYSRAEEAEADRLAIEQAERAAIDPAGVPLAFQTMLEMTLEQPAAGLVIFSTHPSPEWRLERGLERLAKSPQRAERLSRFVAEPDATVTALGWMRPALWFDPNVFPVVLHDSHRTERQQVGVVDLDRVLAAEPVVKRLTRKQEAMRKKFDARLHKHEERLRERWQEADCDRELERAKWLFEVRRANAELHGATQDFNADLVKRLQRRASELAAKKKLAKVYRQDHLPREITSPIDLTDAVLDAVGR